MAKFVIQSEKGRVLHDFAFQLMEAVDQDNWFNVERVHDYVLSEALEKHEKGCIPIGSIEFVLGYYEKNYGITGVQPINIPKELQTEEFLQRKLMKRWEDVPQGEEVFAKSAREFKKFTGFWERFTLPRGKELLISEVIKLKSEWRGFVLDGELLDMRNYYGDFQVSPNYEVVKAMIREYTECPRAYTLDVGVTEEGKTVIIEVHEFFSCGLYGFQQYRNILRMSLASHWEFLKRGRQRD